MEEILQKLSNIETLLHIQTSEILTVKEVAVLIGITPERVYHLINQRGIPCYRNSRGRISFKRDEIEAWKLGDRIETAEEIKQKAEAYVAANPLNEVKPARRGRPARR